MNDSVVILSLLPGFTMPPLILAGILGNLAILSLFPPSSSVNLLFRGLAVADFGVVFSGALLYFPLTLYDLLSESKHYLNYIAFASYLLYPFSNWVQMTSSYTVLLISMERFIAVLEPLRAASMCTKRRAWWALALVWLWSTLFNLPKLWENQLVWNEEDLGQWEADETTWNEHIGHWVANESSLKKDEDYRTVYTMWLHLIFQFLFPWAVAVPLNLAIIVKIRSAGRVRRSMTRCEAQEAQTTRMIVALVSFFCLANSVHLIHSVLEAIVPPTSPLYKHTAYYALQDFSNLLVQLNSAVNFFIYYLFNRSFRRAARKYWVLA